MAQVYLEQVGKKYDEGSDAVADFNLHIADGELLVLVGPSGCGKSTTLRMIAGLEEISSGIIRIGSRIVNNIPPKDRDIAMVFQNYALYPHMSVFDNMAFGLKLRKWPKAEIRERVQRAAHILGLEELLKRKPKALSGGQRQRVAMGRAIVREPAVFLFDEPLSNLDAKMRVEMRKEILQLHDRIGTTMIYVTHDQVEAMTLGNRICVMNNGRMEQVGRPSTVFDHPASLFVARFIGTPPMNIFKGELRAEGNTVLFDGGSFQCPLTAEKAEMVKTHVGQKVCLGIRPRTLSVLSDSAAGNVCISGKVEVSEMLGEEILLHLRSGPHGFIASIHPHRMQLIDPEKVDIGINMKFAHIFDAESGRNLTIPPAVAADTLPAKADEK